jgi:hypothetical protein
MQPGQLLLSALVTVYVFNEYFEQMYSSLFAFYYPGSDQVMVPFGDDSTAGLSERAQEYAERWSSFDTGLDLSGCDSWVDSITIQKRAGLERGIISLVDDPQADSIALLYVSRAPCPYEWEGDSYAIGNEAAYAMSFLRENPGTPLEPYLVLFLMHRLRAQAECRVHIDGLPSDSITALYDSLLRIAVDHPDPLVCYFAMELDSREYVYLSGPD